jgi:hypothetical protein
MKVRVDSPVQRPGGSSDTGVNALVEKASVFSQQGQHFTLLCSFGLKYLTVSEYISWQEKAVFQ